MGNSGTTIRLLTGLLCGAGVSAELDGDESIRKRPMNRIIEPLGMMGAKITASEGGYAPLKIKSASLKGIEYKMSIASAQVKSCLLLAGLFADGPDHYRTRQNPQPYRIDAYGDERGHNYSQEQNYNI